MQIVNFIEIMCVSNIGNFDETFSIGVPLHNAYTNYTNSWYIMPNQTIKILDLKNRYRYQTYKNRCG